MPVQLYLGIFYSMAAIGYVQQACGAQSPISLAACTQSPSPINRPAIGFIVAGSFLSNWVDPGKKPAGVTARDPDWVGAWWAGYVLAGESGPMNDTYTPVPTPS